jgi:hypothetical protein
MQKTNKSIKVKGQLSFPQKTKSPSGATAGGIPPKKWSHFFRKKLASSQTCKERFNLSLERVQAGRRWPGGKDARARDSLRLHEDTALLSCLRPSRLLTKLNFPQPKLTQAKEKTEQRDKQNKKHHLNLQVFGHLKSSLDYLHGHTAQTLTLKQKRAQRPVIFSPGSRRRQERRRIGSPRSLWRASQQSR